MKKILLAVLFITLLLNPIISSAAGLVPCGRTDPAATAEERQSCQFCHFFILFKNVVDFLLFRIVPSLAILMLAIGGFMYVFAYLSPGEALPGGGKGGPVLLGRAKSLISSVIWGLLIIFAAWIIVNTFFMLIGVQEWTGLRQGWWRINCEVPGSGTVPGAGGLATSTTTAPTTTATTTYPPATGATTTAQIPPTTSSNDDIAEDLRISIDPRATTTPIGSSAYDICDNQESQSFRQRYPNVWVAGGCIDPNVLLLVERALDDAYSRLDFDYKETGYILIVPNPDSFAQMLADARGAEDALAFIDSGGTIVLGPEAMTSAGSIIHEEAHQKALAQFGSFRGDYDYQSLYYQSLSCYSQLSATIPEPPANQCGFVSEYAGAAPAEDLAEAVKVALIEDFPYSEDERGRNILHRKFQWLANNRFIRAVPTLPI